MLFLPLWRLSMKTFFDTFPDDDIPELSPNTKVSSLIQAELDRVTRNPRIPGAQQ
jgi:hypothetical protein